VLISAAVSGLFARRRGKRDPVRVFSLFREPRETHLPPGPLARAGLLPVPVAVDRRLDAVGERFLADLRPPRPARLPVTALGVLDLVPSLPQRGQRRLLRLLPGSVVAVQVLLQGPHRPVPGVPASPELAPQARLLLPGVVQREHERLHRPPAGNLEPGHAPIMTAGDDIPRLPDQTPAETSSRIRDDGTRRDHYQALALTSDHYYRNSSNPTSRVAETPRSRPAHRR
jgi:hypothetical protein